MSSTIVSLALAAALLHALWNAILKSGGDRLLVLAAVNCVSGLIALCAIPFVGIPSKESWIYIFLSVIAHTGYYFFLIKAYKHGDLSHVYPLARGAAPLLVVGGAAIFAGELLNFGQLVGIGMACVGIGVLAFESGPPWRRDSMALKYALGTSFWIASYTLIDGIGGRYSGNPFAYIAWLFFLDGLPITFAALYLRWGRIGSFLKSEWRFYTSGGCLSLAAYGMVIYAMSLGAMGVVSAIRETSVLFAALIGVFVLKETFGWSRILAAALVTGGVIVMNFA